MEEFDQLIDFDDLLHAFETGFMVDGDINLLEAHRPLAEQSRERGSVWYERTMKHASVLDKFAKGKYRYGMFPAYRETISTSDFSQLTANLLVWRLLPLYAQFDNQWERLVAIDDTIPDFRQVQVTRVEGFDGPMQAVQEFADYPTDAPIATNKTYKLAKFGKIVSMSWEANLNDYLKMFRYWPERLARAARSTENKFVASLMAGASGPFATLFSTDGSTNGGVINEYTGTTNGPLNEANLIAAYQAMATQTVTNGNPMAVQPRYLVVPPALRFQAEKLVDSPVLIASNVPTTGTVGANTMIPNYNAIPKLGLEVVENRWLPAVDTSGNANVTWYLVAEPGAGAAIEIGFLSGHRTPMIFQKSSGATPVGAGATLTDFQEGDFEHDAMSWKVRHVLGGLALEPRFIQARVGA